MPTKGAVGRRLMGGPATRFKHEVNVQKFGGKGASVYEALRKKRHTRESAARITNWMRSKGQAGGLKGAS